MEELPQITEKRRIPVTIPVPDYLRDHVFRGQAVFPAVEAMQLLARAAGAAGAGTGPVTIHDASFQKFLVIEPGTSSIDAFVEIEPLQGGDITARLITIRKSEKAAITRAVEHAAITVAVGTAAAKPPPPDLLAGLEGICTAVSGDAIYRDLVPFRPAYHTVRSLLVSEAGALATITGGAVDAPVDPLGSPFPLDGSFHAACVWGQRHAGVVGFPVHIGSRRVHRKTMPGGTYFCRVMPVRSDTDLLVFDLWIFTTGGIIFEEIRGLEMRDVRGGTILPPDWIRAGDKDPLAPLRERCRDLSVIELDTLSGPCDHILSEPELERYRKMREKRGTSFCAARIALKRISRRISGDDMTTPPSAISTVKSDGRPDCPHTGGAAFPYCSASHDSRFAVAAVSERPLGIDVEDITERVLTGRHFYMHPAEMVLTQGHPLGEMAAAARVWSIKEAVTKAAGMHLAEAWKRTEVKEIGTEMSEIEIDGIAHQALHAVVEGHIFTLVIL